MVFNQKDLLMYVTANFVTLNVLTKFGPLYLRLNDYKLLKITKFLFHFKLTTVTILVYWLHLVTFNFAVIIMYRYYSTNHLTQTMNSQ